MEYNLAKKLKDAGFPKVGMVEISYKDGIEEELWFPSLSNLIDACGDGFIELKHELRSGNHKWFASCIPFYVPVEGSTSEEAVANLWLKLQEKK